MECGPFGLVSQILVSWERGDLGVILAGTSLLVGAGFSLKTQNLNFVVFSIAMSVILFFFPQFIQGITGISVNHCVEQLQQSRQISRDLSECSAQIPSYSGRGQSCFCVAMDSTPSCSSSAPTPAPGPGSTVTGNPVIYQSGQFTGGPETWTYSQGGTTVTYALQAGGSCEIETMDGQIEEEYCE